VHTLRGLGRHVGAAAISGVIAGVLVAGLAGRIAMRVAGFTSRPELSGTLTSNGNRVGDITFEGTLALALFVGVATGVGGGILYASAEPWLRSRRWKGLIFGMGLLAALGFTVLDATNIDFKRFGVPVLNVAMFAALFIVFGLAIAWSFDRVRRAIDGTGMIARPLEVVAGMAAIVAVGSSIVLFLSPGGLDQLSTVLLIAIAVLVPPIVRWRGLPRGLGYAAFGAPIVVGSVRTLGGLRDLVS